MTYEHDLDLVTWDTAEPLGKVPGSEWVRPQYDAASLQIAYTYGPVTDDDVRTLAGGRDSHLELFCFPEGQHFVRAVDSATGTQLVRQQDLLRYAGQHDKGGYVQAFTHGRPLSLVAGYELAGLESVPDGVQTTITGSSVSSEAADYGDRLQTMMTVVPAAHEIRLAAESATELLPEGHVRVEIAQQFGRTHGQLRLQGLATGLAVTFNAQGAAHTVCAYGEVLGINGLAPVRTGEFVPLEYEDQKCRALTLLAEAMGLNEWNGLDLRMTASGLYQAMTVHGCDITKVLVPRI